MIHKYLRYYLIVVARYNENMEWSIEMLQNDNHPIEGFVIERFQKIIFAE